MENRSSSGNTKNTLMSPSECISHAFISGQTWKSSDEIASKPQAGGKDLRHVHFRERDLQNRSRTWEVGSGEKRLDIQLWGAVEFKPRVKLAAGAGFCKPSVTTGRREVETREYTDLCRPVSPTQTVKTRDPTPQGGRWGPTQSLPSDPHTHASAETQLHCHADACSPHPTHYNIHMHTNDFFFQIQSRSFCMWERKWETLSCTPDF